MRGAERRRRARTAVQGAATNLFKSGVDVLCRGAGARAGARAPDPRGVLRTRVLRQGPATGRHRGVYKAYRGGGGSF